MFPSVSHKKTMGFSELSLTRPKGDIKFSWLFKGQHLWGGHFCSDQSIFSIFLSFKCPPFADFFRQVPVSTFHTKLSLWTFFSLAFSIKLFRMGSHLFCLSGYVWVSLVTTISDYGLLFEVIAWKELQSYGQTTDLMHWYNERWASERNA